MWVQTLYSLGRSWDLKVPSQLHGIVAGGEVHDEDVSQSFLPILVWVFFHSLSM